MQLVSVIVPVYKVEQYLRRCVDSILAQTFTDFDLILVDDGSPDNCGAICDEYAKKDSRVHVIHQKNGGLSAARNAGIDWAFAHSDSQWLTFVDSDDWVHPQLLEQLYHAVQEQDVKVSICGYEETERDNTWEESSFCSKLWPVEQYYVEHNINATVAWGKLYHKDCFRTIRYPVGKIHEDEYVTYRILFAYDRIAVIKTPMYAYFSNPKGITKSRWSLKRLDGMQAYQEQLDFFAKNGFGKAYSYRIVSYYIELTHSYGRMKPVYRDIYIGRRKVLETRKGVFKRMTKSERIAAFNYLYPKMMRNYWRMRKGFDCLKNRISNS